MVLLVSLIICIVGLIVYMVTANMKVQTIALHCFWVGLLAFLFHWTGVIKLLN
jgi:hypothetical protein